MEGTSYQHILYYSPSHIKQLFHDRIEETSTVVHEKEKRRSLKAGLSSLLPGNLGGETESKESIIKSINYDEGYRQTKRVVNNLLSDDSIPRIKDLDKDNIQSLYRFSCECQLVMEENTPSNKEFIEVFGQEGDIMFRGFTSNSNWSSLSDRLYAQRDDIPYPLEGIIQLQDIEHEHVRVEDDQEFLDSAECKVNYIFICQPGQDQMEKWLNRNNLIREYHKRQSSDI